MSWNIFDSNGNLKTRNDTPYAAETVEVVEYTSSGSFVKNDYPNATHIKVRVQSGGGGSGGCAATAGGENAASGGGGGGEYAEKTISVGDLSASETVTVGAGGAGGAAGVNAGSTGGTSSFGSHVTALGGSGSPGSGATSGTNITSAGGQGGFGGTGGADLRVRGSDGGNGIVITATRTRSNDGGESFLGGSQTPENIQGALNGQPQGGGAPGVNLSGSTAARVGRSGGDGIVLVDVYSIDKSALAVPLDAPVSLTAPVNNDLLLYNSSSGVWENKTMHGVKAYIASAQTLANNTWEPVEFDGELHDSGNMHDNVTNNHRLTIPTGGDGMWIFTANIAFTTNSTGIRWGRFYINGTAQYIMPGPVDASVGVFVHHTGGTLHVFDLIAGDYIHFEVFQNSGGNLDTTTGGTACYITGTQITSTI